MKSEKPDSVTALNTGYKQEFQPVKNIRLPMEIKNHREETIASIWHSESEGTYFCYVNGKEVAASGDFSECLSLAFCWLYQEMQNYRKVAEKHGRLTEALRESLSTPWNKL
jgi:hypothetical protein